MRWELGRRSRNVEDRRGSRVGVPVVGGGIGLVLMAIIVTLLGGDPTDILEQGANSDSSGQYTPTAEEEELAEFVAVVLGDTEDTWGELFSESGSSYREPTLVLFSDRVQSACGFAQAAMGPFYCPLDEKVYIDLSFYEDLKYRHQAPGDFAQAYVIAHEVGHHVQNLLGVTEQTQSLQQRMTETEANQLSVMVELQADCFAGVWAYHANEARQIIEQGDVAEALNAASSIGDDRLQRQSTGYVVPESFTHGSSDQRVRWFHRGIETGDPSQCDTFNASRL